MIFRIVEGIETVVEVKRVRGKGSLYVWDWNVHAAGMEAAIVVGSTFRGKKSIRTARDWTRKSV